MLNTRMTATPPSLVTAKLWWHPPVWVTRRQHRLVLQTLLTLAVLALLPGCAANRSVGEATASVGDDVRSLQSNAERGTRNAESSQSLVASAAPNAQPVVLQGRVLFHGTPPPEHEIPLPAPVFAARTNAPLKTRFHRVSPDGGLADALVYVKSGLEGRNFPSRTNMHVIRIQGYEYHPYITAVQTGQPIRWESDVDLNFHPTPTNRANREFNCALTPARPAKAAFLAPEFFLRTKDDVHSWLFGYVNILSHPFFAVTDAEGRFRFPQALPPGKYTLVAVHRRAGEAEQTLDLTQPLPAGAAVPNVEFHFNAPPGGVTTLHPLISLPQRPVPPVEFAPSKPPTRDELLERKARVTAEIKEAEKLYRPTHPKMIGLQKQLESIKEALKQTPPVEPNAANPSPQPSPLSAKREREPEDAAPLAPVAAASQSLVTSSPANADSALGQTRPTSAVTPTPDRLQAAQEEALRRQERKVELEKLLGEAGQFQNIKSWTNAVVRYEEGLLLAPPLNGPFGAPPQVTDAIAGLNYCRLQLAIEHKQRSEFAQATELADKVLAMDPANEFARLIKQLVERVSKPTPSAAVVSVDAADQAKAERLIASTRLRLGQNNTRDALQNLWAALLTNPCSDADSSLLLLLLDKRAEDERVRLAGVFSGQRGLRVPNLYFRTNAERPFLTHSSKGAQLINRKLDQIVLPEIHFDGVPLKDVVKRLADDAKQFDPEKKGLNFLINDVNRTALTATATPALDPNGNPMPAAQPVPLSETLVHLSLPLKGLTLREALDAICKTSEGGAGFTVEEYAVAFIPRGPGASALFSRTFRVSPDAFIQGLQGVVASPVLGVQAGQPTTANGAAGQPAAPAGGVGAAGPVRAVVPPAVPAMQNNASSANTMVRQFFQSAGVSGLSAPNSVTRIQFNPQTGALVVQGTAADLRAVEQALGKLGVNPPAP